MKTSNGQCSKWEGRVLEILSFTSLWRELGVLWSFGLSSDDSDKQQSKNQVMVEFILG